MLHPPSAREFMHEFIGHYVALEGKLWKSLGLLLFRPGRLSLEYIKGKRVRYVQPLRMYLTFSLIFFAVLKFGGFHANPHEGKPAHPAAASAPAAGQAQTPAKPAAAREKIEIAREDKPGELRDGTQGARAWVRGYSPHVADRMGELVEMDHDKREQAVKAAFYAYAPYAIFFMMPVFAFYLKVLYLGTGRRYGAHLLFALHTNAFAFLALTLITLVPAGFGLVEFALQVWLTFYLPVAMQKVYGGRRVLTVVRWIVLMLLHLLTMVVAILAATGYGVLH